MRLGRERPICCLVTSLSRLGNDERRLVGLCAAAADAGVDLIQIREPSLAGRHLFTLTRAIVSAVGKRARVVVNDRTDVALAAGAAGVHLRGGSPSAERIRAVVPRQFLVGRSVHSEAEASAAARTGVDYLILGTIFPTASKPATTAWLGPDVISRITSSVSVPVLAIGGVGADNLAIVAAAGAAGFAAIGLFADPMRTATDDASEQGFQGLVADLRARFLGGAAGR